MAEQGALCVGGPIDGRRVVLASGQQHYYIEELEALSREWVPLDDGTPLKTTTHRYDVFPWHPVTRAVILAHESMTPTEIMESLMDGYRAEK